MHTTNLKISEMTDSYNKHNLRYSLLANINTVIECDDAVISTKTLLFLLPYFGPTLNMWV
jgi:hypothetical protein